MIPNNSFQNIQEVRFFVDGVATDANKLKMYCGVVQNDPSGVTTLWLTHDGMDDGTPIFEDLANAAVFITTQLNTDSDVPRSSYKTGSDKSITINTVNGPDFHANPETKIHVLIIGK